MTLVKATINYEQALAPLQAGELRRLTEAMRSEVEIFYSRGSVADAIASLNKRNDEEKKQLQALKDITLENKSEDELINLLKGQEELLRGRALELLYEKLTKMSPGTYEHNALKEKLRAQPKALVRTLNTKVLEALRMAITILVRITDENFCENFRKEGGLRPLAKLLAMPEILEDKAMIRNVLGFIIKLVTISEENRDGFRQVNGLLRLIPFMSVDEDDIKEFATYALLQCSISHGNQPVIVKTGVVRQIIKNTKSTNYKIKYSSWCLLKNLVQCEHGREAVVLEHEREMISILSPLQVYHADKSVTPQQQEQNVNLQKILLELIYELCRDVKHQKIMGQLNVIQVLEGFFLPLYEPKLKWEYQLTIRVLKAIESIISHGSNLSLFIEARGLSNIMKILQNQSVHPEEVLNEAASVITAVATKSTINQQYYVKIALELLLPVKNLYPFNEEIHEYLASVISSACTGLNKDLVIQKGGDRLLLMFIQESKVKSVLVHACAGLAALASDQEKKANTIKLILSLRAVAYLISLLELNEPLLSVNVARILAAVAESDGGMFALVSNGAIVPLVRLLKENDKEVQEQSLLIFGKILTGEDGVKNIEYFFQQGGDKPLLESLMTSDHEEVQVPALSVVNRLCGNAEFRERLRNNDIELKIRRLETHKNVIKAGSQALNFVRLIKMNLKKDMVLLRRDRNVKAAAAKLKKQIPYYWIKITYEHLQKVIPIRKTIVFNEFIDMLTVEFSAVFSKILLKTGDQETTEIDHTTFGFLLGWCQKNQDVRVTVIPKNPIVSQDFTNNAQIAKINSYLSKINHQQLRVLLKNAIDQGADVANPIRNYILINRKAKQTPTDSKLAGDPYGRGFTTEEEEEEESAGKAGGKKKAGVPGAPGSAAPPPPPPAPPPPPTLTESKVEIKKSGTSAAATGDLISDLRKFQEGEKTLKKVKLDEDELAKRGVKNEGLDFKLKSKQADVPEEVDEGDKLYNTDQKYYVDCVHNAMTGSYDMMNVIFQVVDQHELDWKELQKIVGTKVTTFEIVNAMVTCGFSLKYIPPNLDSGTYEKTYTNVICGSEVPTYIILNVMQMVLVANGGNRVGGAMTAQDMNSVRDGGVVRGYWAKKETPGKEPPPKKETPAKEVLKSSVPGNAPRAGSSPALNVSKKEPPAPKEPPKDVVRGYWAKKDAPTGGSLFDGDDAPPASTPSAPTLSNIPAPAPAPTPAVGASSPAPASKAPPPAKTTYGKRKDNIEIGSLFDND